MFTTEKLERIMKLLIPKTDLIMNELKHENITLGQSEFSDIQISLLTNVVTGALMTGMKTTIEQVLSE